MAARAFVGLLNTTELDGVTFPVIPNDNWMLRHENAGWLSVVNETNPSKFFHMKLMVDGNDFEAPGEGVFIAAGEREILEPIWHWCHNHSIPVWTISQLRADDSALAMSIKNAWKPEHKISGSLHSLLDTISGFNHPEALEQTISSSDIVP